MEISSHHWDYFGGGDEILGYSHAGLILLLGIFSEAFMTCMIKGRLWLFSQTVAVKMGRMLVDIFCKEFLLRT